MINRFEERRQLEADIQDALARNEFELHYQPKLSCLTGQITAFEALLRWRHPQRGVLPPAAFVPLLEEAGLMIDVGEWTIAAACAQAKTWQDQGLGQYGVAVNLGARQLRHGELSPAIDAALAGSGLQPHYLELEVTERGLMENIEKLISTLTEIRRKGVRISVDDFGTGYSSLAVLKQFPLDALKVDRSFVQDITARAEDVSVTRAIIAMGHSLNLRVVAEGVETDRQLALLTASHCDEVQGYLFSKPLPPQEIESLLRQNGQLSDMILNARQQSRTLLIVDDEEDIVAALRQLFRSDGYHVLVAGSGQEGLDLLSKQPVDVILSGQRMPGMVGSEFLRAAQALYPDTIRMVLSEYTELQSVTDAINEGVIAKFLTRPLDDHQLRTHIAAAFRHKEMADENRRLNGIVRGAKEDLAAVHNQLQSALVLQEQQIARGEIHFEVAHELLQHLPLPIIGLDEEGLIAFVNTAADTLLGRAGSVLGCDVSAVLPELATTLDGGGRDQESIAELNGRRFTLKAHSMGQRSLSKGTLITLTGCEAQ
jgi:EAL domain-containing protein (putative c-di-GMP-specific phosphodiesterase class I)/CheY-like chemotaxis protein